MFQSTASQANESDASPPRAVHDEGQCSELSPSTSRIRVRLRTLQEGDPVQEHRPAYQGTREDAPVQSH